MKKILIIITAMFFIAPLYVKATATPIEDATENWLQPSSNDEGDYEDEDYEDVDGDLRDGPSPFPTVPVTDAFWLVALAAAGYGVRLKTKIVHNQVIKKG